MYKQMQKIKEFYFGEFIVVKDKIRQNQLFN